MKTLEDLETDHGECTLELGVYSKELRKLVIDWIKEIRKKSADHWSKLDEFGFTNFPETETEDCYSFQIDGLTLYCWHESTDTVGATKILEHIFNITEEELDGTN